MMKRKGSREPSHGILKVPAKDARTDGQTLPVSPRVKLTNGANGPQGGVKFEAELEERNGLENNVEMLSPSPRASSRVSSASSRHSDSSMVSSLNSMSLDNVHDLSHLGTRRSLSVMSQCSSSTAGQGPLAHLGFAGSRHMHPERLPTMRFQKAVNLRLTDLSPESLENFHTLAPTLRRLELSHLGLKTIPKDILTNLEGLEALGLTRNSLGDNSFPDIIKNLKSLVDLKLDYNGLTNFPQNLQKLKTLQRLGLSQNQLKTVEGLEKLKRLTILVLDNNKLTSLFAEISTMRRLEVCYCSNNLLSEVQPAAVKLLRHLRTVDISNNSITSLPPELFTLPHLDLLNASNNKINRLPTITIRGVPKHVVKHIDLSENLIIRFPEHLLVMGKSLDISNNKISKIAGNTIRKLAWRTEKHVDLAGNPLIAPPIEICECGLRAMIGYFQELKTQMKSYQGMKLMVVGPSMSGKTSLVQSMMDEQPRVEDPEDRTIGIDVFEMPIETAPEGDPSKPLNVSVWDYSGNSFYRFTHYYFLEQPNLILLTFDLSTYTKQKFEKLLDTWLQWVIAKTKHLVLIVAGTQMDKVKKGPTRVAQICKEALEGVNAYFACHFDFLDRAVKDIESRPTISPALSEQFKLYMQLKKLRLDIYPEVLATSAATLEGVADLQKAIQTWALNKDIFPRNMREIPSLWLDVECWLEEQGNLMPVPIVSWEEFTDMVSEKFGMRHLMTNIAEYLHETGKILYGPNSPTFSEYVVLRPPMFLDAMKTIIRHDLDILLDYAVDDKFKSSGMGVVRFNKYKSDFLQGGVLDREFAKILWSGVVMDDGRPEEVMRHLVYKYELGYPVGKKHKNGTFDLTVLPPDPSLSARSSSPISESGISTTSKGGRKHRKKHSGKTISDAGDAESVSSKKHEKHEIPVITKLMFPSQRQAERPESVKNDLAHLLGNPSACTVFRFPRFIPPGLFERFCTRIRIHDDKYEFNFSEHWQNGVIAAHGQKRVLLYLQKVDEDEGGCHVRIEVRHLGLEQEEVDEDTEKAEIESMWACLLPVVHDMEKLLEQFPGACFQRLMACPACEKLGFIGEWLNPKELQNMQFKECSECGESISTVFLVQPREKRGAELIKMKNERARLRKLEEERRLADLDAQPNPSEAAENVQRVPSPNVPRKSKESTVEAPIGQEQGSANGRKNTVAAASDLANLEVPRRKNTSSARAGSPKLSR
ncbi:malignant fibrous histiocytoma-amplified sequence 1 homolog [Lineus longissimus]|uniref:malignant fibrous histiocytoma-amplified sequence 1 homolog n=1 Tax=Lineus longissimus TaxID=88925 RepID=UPI00315CE056